jgi:hypothetical protein
MPDTADLDSFRSEVRSWLERTRPPQCAVCSPRSRAGQLGRRRPVFDPPEMKTWLERRCRAVHRADLAEGVRRRRALEGQAKVLEQEMAARSCRRR